MHNNSSTTWSYCSNIFHAITKSVCTKTQAKKSISIKPICLTDSDYDYILEEIGCLSKIGFERYVEVYIDDE